jgi:hypothetical protein
MPISFLPKGLALLFTVAKWRFDRTLVFSTLVIVDVGVCFGGNSEADMTIPTPPPPPAMALPAGKEAAVHLTGLASATTEQDVTDAFDPFRDHIVSVFVPADRKKRDACRGYAFVHFREFGQPLIDALKALDGSVIAGREVRCRLADKRSAEGAAASSKSAKVRGGHNTQQSSAQQPMATPVVSAPSAVNLADPVAAPAHAAATAAAPTKGANTTTAAALRFKPRVVVAHAKRGRDH